MAILSLTEYRTYAQYAVSDTGDDSLITAMIAAAENYVISVLGYDPSQATTSVEFAGHGRSTAYIGFLPIAASPVPTLSYRSKPTDEYVGYTATEFALYVVGDSNYIYSMHGFSVGYQYKLTASIGYSSGTMPPTLKQAVYELAYTLVTRIKDGTVNTVQISNNLGSSGHSTQYADALNNCRTLISNFVQATI